MYAVTRHTEKREKPKLMLRTEGTGTQGQEGRSGKGKEEKGRNRSALDMNMVIAQSGLEPVVGAGSVWSMDFCV